MCNQSEKRIEMKHTRHRQSISVKNKDHVMSRNSNTISTSINMSSVREIFIKFHIDTQILNLS